MSDPRTSPSSSSTARLVSAWLVVGAPFLYGVYQVVVKALALFQSTR